MVMLSLSLISYIALTGLTLWVIPVHIGACPYANLFRPVGAYHCLCK